MNKKIIYHVTTKEDWQKAEKEGFYEAPSLYSEGFIHCSEEHQVEGVLKRYFSDKAPLIKLVIDPYKLNQRLQYDFSAAMNDTFPHIYGRLNMEAIVEIIVLD